MNPDVLARIQNHQLVTDAFGRWPSTHDAEVHSIHIERDERRLTLTLEVFSMDGATDERGLLERQHLSLLTLSFLGVDDVMLKDFNEQNSLSALSIDDDNDGGFTVRLRSFYGLEGSFVCDVVRVDSLEPYAEEERAPTDVERQSRWWRRRRGV